ncbi:MAG: T9SS type A sorting domain-containing protein [Taibaiella sp.]|nr:T9SS type A sorting domain-containing protein [Taibaiella sp.]
MFCKIFLVIHLALLTATPVAIGQHFNKLYDYDSTADFGSNIFQQKAGNYFIINSALNNNNLQNEIGCMFILSNGILIGKKNILYSNSASFYSTTSGRVKLYNNKFLVPITIQAFKGNWYSSRAGLAVLDSIGDSIYTKIYTDSNLCRGFVNDIAVLPDKGYLLVGQQGDTSYGSPTSVMVIRTDSNGNMIWKHLYAQPHYSYDQRATSVQVLSDGRYLIGAGVVQVIANSIQNIIELNPWFIIMNDSGNIIKDAFWGAGYTGGGNIFKDVHGGYFHWGAIDTLLNPTPSSLQNFPSYITHLDSNFNINWIKRFPYKLPTFRKEIFLVKQLHNGDYLLLGDEYTSTVAAATGWATKVNQNGTTLWDNMYICDSNQDSYLVDAVENSDGTLVMTGAALSDTLPHWRGQDLWLVSVDANGCIIPGCKTTSINTNLEIISDGINIYPNPITNKFVVKSNGPGTLLLYDLTGRLTCKYNIKEGYNNLVFPSYLTNGIYIAEYKDDKDPQIQVIRLVYQP